jgi:hypothetical protein
MAYSRSKMRALVPVLESEMDALGSRVRAVVIADFERTSAVTEEVEHLLDEEAGGAVAAFRALVGDERTDRLDPVLVTGSSVLVDDDLADGFLEESRSWLAEAGREVELRYEEGEGFHVLAGRGADWCPRVYVNMITHLFQRGVTRCLVGTRGLLGEGWDASKANVLIDLTTVTTSMTVNQLRGRSIRLDPEDPEKVANNWDVICIAPEYRKGLDDYRRFISKHQTLFGVTDDGAIEKGVGHVHPAFTEIRPEGIEGNVAVLNDEMLERNAQRKRARELWKIGTPYNAVPVHAAEVQPGTRNEVLGLPPFPDMDGQWSPRSLATAIGRAILGALREKGEIDPGGQLQAGERSDNYVRLFLKDASEENMRLFTRCVEEALGPLRRPRYIIPRHIEEMTATWVSQLLPSVLGRYFRKRTRRLAMWHSVPSALAGHKETARIYEKHWNEHVSPGEAIYAHRGEGEQIAVRARREGRVPAFPVHTKDIFF